MEALFETVAKDTKKGLRDRVILELLYATGIRVSELVNIQLKDIDMSLPGVKVLEREIKNVLFRLENFVVKALNNT